VPGLRQRRARRGVSVVAGVGGLALLLWALYGLGFTGYDSMFGLAWGEDIANLRSPHFEGAVQPTPHPLGIAVAVALAPLSAVHAAVALQLVALVAFAGLGWVAWRLGRALFGEAVGVLFALILVSRPLLAGEALQALVDVPFLALVLGACAAEAQRPRRGLPVLALLALAGLLRPEAWVLSAAYVTYLLPGLDVPSRLRAAALALSAPLAWALLDLAVSGDPLHSLHRTQDLAERIERPRGVGSALDLLPRHLERVLQAPLVWLGLAGAVIALALLYRRALLPAAVLALGLGSFLILGVADLPLLERYLLVPSAMLGLLAAVALLGWASLPRGRVRWIWMAGAIPCAVWLALSGPGDVRELDRVSSVLDARGRVQRDLLELGGGGRGARLLAGCEPVSVPGTAVLPSLVFLREDRDNGLVVTRGVPAPGSRLAPATTGAGRARALGLPPGAGRAARALGFRAAVRNRSWVFYARCG
jgi:hypothetical protein